MKPLDMGGVVKQLREARGLTQTQLAHDLGYNNRTTIAKIEAGSNGLSKAKLEQLAEKFGVSVDYLFNSLERSLYALDFVVSDLGEKVVLENDPSEATRLRCEFTKSAWEEFKMAGKIEPVIRILESGAKEYKKTPDTLIDIESLSEDKKVLVDYVMSLSDAEARVLRGMFAAKPQTGK